MINKNSFPTLYCCCIDNHPPRYSLVNGKLIPILAGATYCDINKKNYYKNNGWILDDEKDNISDLNQIWGDLTALYWIWKNSKDQYVGICQYRRSWEEEDIKSSEENILYVPTPGPCPVNLKFQYEIAHPFPGYNISINLAKDKKIPLTEEMLQNAWHQPLLYAANMIRGPKDLYDKFSELMFEIMIPFYEQNKEMCESIYGYQRRSIAFCAERMMTAVILYKDHFFGYNKIKHAKVNFIQ